MNLRYAILGLLAAAPASGFDLVRRFARTAGYAWSAHHSQIYPELARCLRDGLIEEVGSGPRGKRTYRTTDAGLAAVQTWLASEDVDRTVRSEPTLRSFFTWLLEPHDAADVYRREARYHQAQLEELTRIRHEFDAADGNLTDPQRSARITLERGLRLHAVLAEWAVWAAESAMAPVAAGKRGQ